VEPKYGKKLETLDELLDSDVIYGYQSVINFGQDILSYPEFVKFLEHKRLKEDCSDVRKCVERMVTKRDIASVIVPLFATYVAREMGTADVGKVICFLDQVKVCVRLIDFEEGKSTSGQIQRPNETLFGSRFPGKDLVRIATSSLFEG